MLHVNPKLRPDTTKLLESQILQQKAQQYLSKQKQAYQSQSQTHSELLKTIIFPKSLNQMKSKLPPSRYQEEIMSEAQVPQYEKPLDVQRSNLSLNTKDTSNVSLNL